MERQLFNWEDRDLNDCSITTYYDCTLKVDIGFHKVGERIPIIEIDWTALRVHIGQETFKLGLTVTEE